MVAPPGYDVLRFGCLHDAKYDSVGRRLATASSDGVVRIWCADSHQMVAQLPAHQAAALVVGWAPKKTLPVQLVSGAADGSILLWREQQSQWSSVHQLTVRGSVVAASFRPAEYGLMLAVAGSESPEIVFLTRKEVVASPVLPAGEQWLSKVLEAHTAGLVGFCWAPAASPATLAAGPAAARAAARAPLRLVSASSDSVKIWRGDEKSDAWSLQHELVERGSGPAVRDVAWRPNLGIPSSSIAVCFEDGLLQIWWQDMDGQPWNVSTSWNVGEEAFRLAWSTAGSLLAVTGSEQSHLFKEAGAGQWANACQLGE